MRSGFNGIIVVLITFTFCTSVFADTPPAAHWPLDGTAADVSGYARHGTPVNDPVWVPDGAVNECLLLDGIDDYIRIDEYKGITGSTSRTCSAWIKTTGTGMLLSWGNEANGQKWTFRVESDGTLGVGVWGGYIRTALTVNDGQWHHVAAVLADDGSPSVNEIRLYIDGILQTASPSNAQEINTVAMQDVMIGAANNNGSISFCFDGYLDDVRIYDNALTTEQIAEIYVYFDGGDGSASDPFQISSPLQLAAIGSNPQLFNKHFILMNDLDLSGRGYTHALIAADTNPESGNYEGIPFTGSFDGNRHTIYNMTLAGAECLGLFGKIGENGTVMDLSIENADVEGDWAVGVLCGINEGLLMDCSSTGRSSGRSSIGGLCGFNEGVISGCSAVSQIASEESAGGLCALNRHEAVLTNCYARGTIDGSRNVGGLCSWNQGTLMSCYSTCSVPEVDYPVSYYIGGLCGRNDGTFERCFWDIEASGSDAAIGDRDKDPVGTLGLTTAAMQKKAMYIFQGWDFAGESINGEEGIWRICVDGQDYPKLSWEFDDGSYGDCDAVVELALPGSGTENDPYLISEPLHLYELGHLLFEAGTHLKLSPYSYPYFYVSMVNDIDMTGIRMNFPVGWFLGFFEGNGHTIRHLTIDCKQGRDVGLFDSLGFYDAFPNMPECVIQNLHLEDASVVGGLAAGTIVGSVESGGVIRNCSSTGSVYSVYMGDPYLIGATAGGLVGGLWGGAIENCTASCSVSTAQAWSSSSYAGALIGKVQGTVSNCYANGSVLGYHAGGIAGVVFPYGGAILNCYSTAHIEADSGVGGGIAGQNLDGELISCFWDTGTSGVSVGVGDGSATGTTGRPTLQMQTAATFTDAGWDFVGESADGENEIWRMCADGVAYPRLSWEFARNGDFACGSGVDLADLEALAGAWLTAASLAPDNFNHAADANGDGRIDAAEFNVLSENW